MTSISTTIFHHVIETDWLYVLLAILGFHGMLNQVQYHHAFVSGDNDDSDDDDDDEKKGGGGSIGFQGQSPHDFHWNLPLWFMVICEIVFF